MSFSDIFKSSFLENVNSFSLTDAAIALALSFVIGLFIFMIYKKTFQGVMYSSSFGTALIALTMITTFVILAVTSNVVLSLGMVGALSIVRFRTAIKEPLDIAYLFWAIAVGIVLGAGLIPLALIGSIVLGIVLYVFANKRSYDSPYLLIVSYDSDAQEKAVFDQISARMKKYVIKSKTVTADGVECTVEIRLPDMETSFVNGLLNTDGVRQAVLVSYNGDYMA
jgi:uncharacterized membrane protein YhiD involved in acid resistance